MVIYIDLYHRVISCLDKKKTGGMQTKRYHVQHLHKWILGALLMTGIAV